MISQTEINHLVQNIVASYHPDKVIMFGSYAVGNQTENSDLDLLIIKNTELPPHKRTAEISALLKGILFPIDILIYTNTEFEQMKNQKFSFLYQALAINKILYEQPRNNTTMVA
jgi:predicted nucleotidyltransferase